MSDSETEDKLKALQREVEDLRWRYSTLCLALHYEWSGREYDTETCNRLVSCIDDIDPVDYIRVVCEVELKEAPT